MPNIFRHHHRFSHTEPLPPQFSQKNGALGSNSHRNRSKVEFMSQEIKHEFTSQDLDYGFMRILDFQNFDQIG